MYVFLYSVSLYTAAVNRKLIQDSRQNSRNITKTNLECIFLSLNVFCGIRYRKKNRRTMKKQMVNGLKLERERETDRQTDRQTETKREAERLSWFMSSFPAKASRVMG